MTAATDIATTAADATSATSIATVVIIAAEECGPVFCVSGYWSALMVARHRAALNQVLLPLAQLGVAAMSPAPSLSHSEAYPEADNSSRNDSQHEVNYSRSALEHRRAVSFQSFSSHLLCRCRRMQRFDFGWSAAAVEVFRQDAAKPEIKPGLHAVIDCQPV
eukprot:gene29924-39725_t